MTRRLVVVVALVLLTTGCLEGRSYHQSEPLRIQRPDDRGVAANPVLVEFVVSDAPDELGGFAVFTDVAPIAPGHSLDEIEGVELAFARRLGPEDRSVELNINRKGSGPDGLADRHVVTIVMLDADGERLTDSYDAVEFDIEPQQ